MSRERPESWDEVVDNRDYYTGSVVFGSVVRNGLHLRSIYLHLPVPPDLLLVPTRAEWEATQKSSADLRDAAMLIRRLLRRIPEHRIPEQQAQNWLERKGLQGSVLRGYPHRMTDDELAS